MYGIPICVVQGQEQNFNKLKMFSTIELACKFIIMHKYQNGFECAK